MKKPMIIAALLVSGGGLTMSTLVQAEAVEMAHKEAVTDELGEGEIRDYADGSQMVGADYFTVYIEGEGPDVVLIPSLSTPRAVWDKTREQLKGRFKVHTIQTRGFGDKAPVDTLTPEARSLLDSYAFHLADYIDDYLIEIGRGQRSGGDENCCQYGPSGRSGDGGRQPAVLRAALRPRYDRRHDQAASLRDA